MNQTIFAQEFIEAGTPFAVEMPPTALAGHPYMDAPTPLAIMNDKGSGVTLRVRRANLRPNTGSNALSSILQVMRITAIVAGETIVPEKFDSASADLPAQVSIRKRSSSVTATAGSQYRRAWLASEMNPTRALAQMCAMANGDSRMGLDSGELMRLTGDADVTGIILREGEGLAFVYATDSPSHSYAINFRFRNVATGETYRVAEVVTPRYIAGDAPLAILNGAGSGVVLEIEKAQAREIGTDEIVLAYWGMIDGLSGCGCDSPYILADTSLALPAGVRVRNGAIANRLGSKVGALITSPYMRRITLSEPPYGPGIAGGPQICRRGLFSPDFSGDDEGMVILREGQGYALFLLTAGAQVAHEATLVVEVATAGAGVYPSPDDVRNGIDYGPTGAEYDGDLVLPAAADVKQGTGYGADGTELVGTLVGGGGGGAKSFAF
jgi:hypothetical protein